MNLNKKMLLIVFILSVFSAYAQECSSKVEIKTNLLSAKIYLDNILIGKGKAEIELGKGKYHLVVMEESDRWDALTFNDTLNIKDCSDTSLIYVFNSEVYLNTVPQDVGVYQDSVLVGHTPLFLPVNSKELILKKPGFEDKKLKTQNLRLDDKIGLKFIGKIKGESFFEKNIFKILIGGIVALGGVTAYFKLKADNNFDKYQVSGDKYYLDRTHKFDLISGISFGAVQVGFGFLIYYFLSD